MLKNIKTFAVITTAPMGALRTAADDIALPKGYRLVWADEFNGKGHPTPTAGPMTPRPTRPVGTTTRSSTTQARALRTPRSRGGVLRITARKEAQGNADWGGRDYSSTAHHRGKADWLYGFFEVRAKLPCGRAPGRDLVPRHRRQMAR